VVQKLNDWGGRGMAVVVLVGRIKEKCTLSVMIKYIDDF
jgi:hypothetical protein